MKILPIITIFLAMAAVRALAIDAKITIDASKTGPRLSPVQHGIFYEEINHAGDGGLNAEQVRNPNFADRDAGWSPVQVAGATVRRTYAASGAGSGLPHTLTVQIEGPAGARGGIRSDGYFGIGVRAGETYVCKVEASGPARELLVELLGADGRVLGSYVVHGIRRQPRETRLLFRPTESDSRASLRLTLAAPGEVSLRFVSLQPELRSGRAPLRPDLYELIRGMKPSFVRFPGGCFVEGDRLANRFHWKTTLGPARDRVSHSNLWGYTCTNGLGYHEFLQMCEELKAEPLFVVNCGMSHSDTVPMAEMQTYVQDALDAIEYANGPVTSAWGARRAAAGHPKPFNLRYVEIGNENGWGNTLPLYEERYALFHDAIKARWPQMRLVANVPIKSRPMDISDEHYYSSPQFFVQQSRRYDNYPRSGPKVYVGEYAVTQGCGRGNLIAALGEAYFITGMERNADVVEMASYAPLLVNVSDRKWNPDAIVFDSLRSYGTPSYWVQRMFSQNRGDVALRTDVRQITASSAPAIQWKGAVGVGTWATQAEFRNLRVERAGKVAWSGDSAANPLRAGRGRWTVAGGEARQESRQDDCRAVGGDAAWDDLTFTCQARKTGGSEGFLILFRVKGNDDYFWWNLGGWGNTRHNIEHAIAGAKSLVATDVTGRIETGRWYDIRVELAGSRIRCYLDGKRVHDVDYRGVADAPLGVVTTREDKTGDVLVKVVNMASAPRDTEIEITGVAAVKPRGTALVMSSASPLDENSLESPTKVAPKTVEIDGAGPRFRHTFPANSVSILRLRTR